MRDLSSDENSSAADGDKKCSLLSLFVHDIALCVMLLYDIALSVMLLHVAALRVSVNVSGSVAMQCSRAPWSTKGFLKCQYCWINNRCSVVFSAGGVGWCSAVQPERGKGLSEA